MVEKHAQTGEKHLSLNNKKGPNLSAERKPAVNSTLKQRNTFTQILPSYFS